MTPNNIAKVNRRLKAEGLKVRRYGSGHCVSDLNNFFICFLSVCDLAISTVDELVAICRIRVTKAREEKAAQEMASVPDAAAPVKKKTGAKTKGPVDVRGVEIGIGDLVAYGDCSGSTLYTHYVVRITPAFVWMAGDPDRRSKTGNARREHKRVCVIEKAA